VFTRDLDRPCGTSAPDAGAVLVNESPTFRADHDALRRRRPAGHTREGPAATVRELTVEKLVVLLRRSGRPRA
jgi:hypothetical protein